MIIQLLKLVNYTSWLLLLIQLFQPSESTVIQDFCVLCTFIIVITVIINIHIHLINKSSSCSWFIIAAVWANCWTVWYKTITGKLSWIDFELPNWEVILFVTRTVIWDWICLRCRLPKSVHPFKFFSHPFVIFVSAETESSWSSFRISDSGRVLEYNAVHFAEIFSLVLIH